MGGKEKSKRGRSPMAKSEKDRKKRRSDTKKKEKKRSKSTSSSSSSSEDAELGAEAKLAEAIGQGFGLKPKSLKFSKQTSRVSDLSPYLLACVLCRATPDLTEQTIMRLGGELYEAGLPLPKWTLQTTCIQFKTYSDLKLHIYIFQKHCT